MNEEEFVNEKDDGISSYLKGFQKGKLEQKKEEIEFLKNIKNKYYREIDYFINEEIKQLQKEIGGNEK